MNRFVLYGALLGVLVLCASAMAPMSASAVPKVKAEPKTLTYKKLKFGEKEELLIRYTNEGPGEWNSESTIFEGLKGSVFAWSLGHVIECAGKIKVGVSCDNGIVFAPNEEKQVFEANINTHESSEKVVAKGESE